MKVLLISHTCMSPHEGQPKAQRLAEYPDIDLRVLIPDRWFHYDTWRTGQLPEDADYACEIGKVVWPWSGLAKWYLHWYRNLAATLQEFRPDIIDIWEEPWGLVSAQTCWLRDRILPHAKIITETEQNIDKSLPLPFEQFRTYTLKKADFAIARSEEAAAILRRKGFTKSLEVVPNAVNVQVFKPLDSEACRRALGLSGFVVGYVGRLVPEKGLMDLLEAFFLCPRDTTLLFVGSGPLQPLLEQRARQRGYEAQVRFLPNRPAHELPQIMSALDTLVLPSRTTATWKEQFGRVIIESQACGTPVIGSDSGAIPDVVGKGGLIVPEGNVESLASALYQLRACPDQRERLGAIGRRQVQERYSWRQVAIQMRAIYWNLLCEPGLAVVSAPQENSLSVHSPNIKVH